MGPALDCLNWQEVVQKETWEILTQLGRLQITYNQTSHGTMWIKWWQGLIRCSQVGGVVIADSKFFDTGKVCTSTEPECHTQIFLI